MTEQIQREPRTVFLDPDDTFSEFVGVIIQFPTGVRYQHQCAGTECAQRAVEGYYVPLGGLRFDPQEGTFDPEELRKVFHRRDGCVWGWQSRNVPPNTSLLPADRLARLRELVESIVYWTGDERGHLLLDETRLGELAEAWVPVITPEGAGILVWKNCD